MGMHGQVAQSAADDHSGEQKINRDDGHGQLHHPLAEATTKDLPEDEAKDREHEGDYHLPVPVADDLLPEQREEELLDRAIGATEGVEGFLPHGLRVVDEVFRGVGYGECLGDDEV